MSLPISDPGRRTTLRDEPATLDRAATLIPGSTAPPHAGVAGSRPYAGWSASSPCGPRARHLDPAPPIPLQGTSSLRADLLALIPSAPRVACGSEALAGAITGTGTGTGTGDAIRAAHLAAIADRAAREAYADWVASRPTPRRGTAAAAPGRRG